MNRFEILTNLLSLDKLFIFLDKKLNKSTSYNFLKKTNYRFVM